MRNQQTPQSHKVTKLTKKFLWAWVLLLAGAAGAWGAPSPVLNDLAPRGAQRGKAFTLTLTGAGLEGASVVSTLPASFTRLALKEGRSAESELAFLVELKADAAVGLYPIRVKTADGLSNVLLFSVGAFPETAEEESEPMAQDYSNDSPQKAQPIPVPITVNGKLRGPDQDFYRFQAKKGDRLVFEVEARRAGSAVDPMIRVLDSAGQELARNDDAPGLGVDARVEVVFPSDGEYYVLVHDTKFSTQAQNFYRLKIGAFAYASGIFPLGWRRGGQVEVELFGGNLPAPVKVRPDLAAVGATQHFALVPVPGSPGSIPLPFAVGDRREILEPAGSDVIPLEPETVVNGRISRPQEVDRYKLAVSPGDHWLVELQNASLGTSRLYGVLTVYDSTGKKLASAGDTGKAPDLSFLVSAGDTATDPYLAFKVPPSVREIVVTVEDLLRRGGPDYGYRLVAEKQPPDFTLTLATPYANIPVEGSVSVVAVAERRGYLGPIKLSIPELPDDLLVEGGHIPGEVGAQTLARVSRQGILTITPKPGAKERTLELAVFGEGALEDGRVIRRRALGPGMVTAVRGAKQKPFVAPWLGLELPAMVVKERPASLDVVTPRYVKLIQGMEYDVEWKFVRRLPGIRPPMRVNGDNVPGVGNLRVLRGKSKDGGDTGTLTLVTTVGTPPMKFDMLLDATVTIDGREEKITAPAITFDVVQGYTIEPSAKPAVLPPGRKAEVVGRIGWEAAFSAPVTVKAENLPVQVTCRPMEVAAKTEEFRLPCQAGPSAAPGEYEIELVSSSTLAGRDKEKVPYTIPPVKARLIVPAPGKVVAEANQ